MIPLKHTTLIVFDFSTLYTSIPHSSLKNNLNTLVKEAYTIRGAKYLNINRQGIAYWSQSQSGGNGA